MDGMQIRLFGELSIQQRDRPLLLPAGKALELFCYLLLHCDRAHTREILSELLWPGGKSSTSRSYLRQALWRLSAAIQYPSDSCGERTELFLISDHGWVRINPEVPWWLDVSEFEQAYVTTRDIAGHSLSDRQARDLEAALELYRGDLLPTWYQDWCSYERDRLQLVYLAMLDQLMAYCEARQRYAKGLSLGQTVLRYDPTRECTHRQLMRLHYRVGDRTSAMRQYERCTSAIAQEFGIQPSADTVALYEQIRAGRVPDLPLPAQTPVPGPRDTIALTDLCMRLDQIQASLYVLQESVTQGRDARLEHARATQNGSPEKANGLRD